MGDAMHPLNRQWFDRSFPKSLLRVLSKEEARRGLKTPNAQHTKEDRHDTP